MSQLDVRAVTGTRTLVVSQDDWNELARLADLVLAGPDARDREGTWHGRANHLAQRVMTILAEAQEREASRAG